MVNNTYFIADSHHGHGNIMKYCRRPQLSVSELAQVDAGDINFRVSAESIDYMDDQIIDNINAVVGEDDTLWHLGDFAFADYAKSRDYRNRINCKRMYLIMGNHDKKEIGNLFTNCYDQYKLRVGNQIIWLNHYPLLSVDGAFKGAWMLHGHVHGNIRKDPLVKAVYDKMRICDVGVDGPCRMTKDGVYDHTFRPWSMLELHDFMRAKDIRNP